MTLITMYTPTHRRPTFLARCKASVEAQAERDALQHLIVEDTEGMGIAQMFATVHDHDAAILGQYVYFLCDDDMLLGDDLMPTLREWLEANGYPDVVMCKMLINGQVFPLNWQQEPVVGFIGIGCYIVSRRVWCAVPFGAAYEGDHMFIAEVWRRAAIEGWRIAWWDRAVSATQSGYHYGRPET